MPNANTERFRETCAELPSEKDVEAKLKQGWRLAAIEWVRSRDADASSGSGRRPIPFGLRISDDCNYLEIDPNEKQMMSIIIAMIAGDHPLSAIAAELNRREMRTRDGKPWTQVSIFRLLPRVVEFGPEILSADEWSGHKDKLLSAVS